MDQASLVEIGLPAALFLIMVGMGLTLTPKDFREVLIAPGPPFTAWWRRSFCCRWWAWGWR